MRALGFVLIVVGIVGAIFALNMDVSVSTGFGSVNNIGLMDDRRNYLILSGLVVIVGVLLALFGGSRTAVNPHSDPFDDADRARTAERQRFALSLGVTRTDGVYHYRGEACAGLEEAIAKASAARGTVEMTDEMRARRAEMDREANKYVDRIMIIGGAVILIVAIGGLLMLK